MTQLNKEATTVTTQPSTPHCKPMILVSCDREDFRDRRGEDRQRYFCDADYVRAISQAGGAALLVPYLPHDHLREVLKLGHALVLSGGDFDVPPAYYGEKPGPLLGRLVEERSEAERFLLEGALRANMPILGICGGMQLLNVVCGGSLFQDLSLRFGTAVHQQTQRRSLPSHPVLVAPNTQLSKIFSQNEVQVNSTHHQVVRQLGRDVVACGHAPDGVVEAIELAKRDFCLGVQWHPEALEDSHRGALYGALVQAASRFAGYQNG